MFWVFFFSILKLLLLVKNKNAESTLLCSEAQVEHNRKASLSGSRNWLRGDLRRGLGSVHRALTARPFLGYLALKGSCSNPAKIKGGLHRLWAGPLNISIWQSPLLRSDLLGEPKSADLKKPDPLLPASHRQVWWESFWKRLENAFCGGKVLMKKEPHT